MAVSRPCLPVYISCPAAPISAGCVSCRDLSGGYHQSRWWIRLAQGGKPGLVLCGHKPVSMRGLNGQQGAVIGAVHGGREAEVSGGI